MRSGDISPQNTAGTFKDVGLGGCSWSSYASTYTSSITATAYTLAFSTVSASSGERSRWYGFPLRCLSTVLDI